LTQQERAQVNREQNHVSREIDRDKHNARVDHPVEHQNAEHAREAHPREEHPHR
jgi:hypothetical protein